MNKGGKTDVTENNEAPRSPLSPPTSPLFSGVAEVAAQLAQLTPLLENNESPIDETSGVDFEGKHILRPSTVCLSSQRSVHHVQNDTNSSLKSPDAKEADAATRYYQTVVKADSDSCATVRERNAAMLLNDCMADVWFIVGPSEMAERRPRYPAHAYVLATGSTVFYAMFFGGFGPLENVDVPDVDPTAFRILLKYLYTDEVELDSDTVLPTLYAAKKYLVTHLIRICIQFLENSLNAQNVCLLLSQSRLFEEEKLMQRCWDVVDAQTELSLSSDGFLEIDTDTLKCIISRETLSCREIAVFQACLRWAEAECNRRNIVNPNSREKRQVLADCFNMIRFSTMKVEELANIAAPSGLLEPNEVADIFLFHFARQKPDIPFLTTARSRLPVRRCQRFQTSAYRGNQWRYRGRCDSIQFCTDRRIFVVGLGLYGSSSGSAEYKVHAELKRCGQSLASTHSRLYTDGSSSVFPVHFDQPVQIEPDVYYTASVILDGSELSYFGQEGLQEVNTDNVTFQFQCSTESTNGTGVQGGQIPEILFYG